MPERGPQSRTRALEVLFWRSGQIVTGGMPENSQAASSDMTQRSEEPSRAADEAGNASRSIGGGNSEELDRSLVRGMAWTAGVKWSSLVVTWAATLIVARTLTPDDYGLVAMAFVFTSLVEMLSDFGMGMAIVKHRDLTPNQIGQIHGLCVLLGVAGWALACLAAYPLALFFQAPALFAVLAILGANFVIAAFRIVPLSLMQRDLQLRAVAINDGSQAILQSVCMVILAIAGLKYWALVLGTLLGGLLTTVLACRARPTALVWPRHREIREAVTFGSHLIVLRFSHYVMTNADQLVVGKLLGPHALGGYSIAMTLALMPMEKITSLVMRVLPSVISSVQHDLVALRRYVRGFSEALSVVTMPAAVGLALVAEDFVHLALGEGWQVAILPLQILSLSVAYRSVTPVIPSVAVIVGLSGLSAKASIVAIMVLPAAFLVGAHWWGIGGVAAAWLIAYPLVVFPYFYLVLRRIRMGAGEYLRALWPATSSTAFMAAVVYGVHQSLHPHWHAAFRLTAEVLVGALAYALFLFALHRKRVLALRDIYRLMRSK